MLDIDSVRTALVLGMVVAFFVYQKFHLVGGGATTASFFILMILSQRVDVLIWVTFTAVASWLIVQMLMLRLFPLTRTWVFYTMVLTSTLINGAGIALSTAFGLQLPWLYQVAMFGAFIVPGIVAYDFAHQGFRSTAIALGLMIALGLILTLPVINLLALLDPGVSAMQLQVPLHFPRSYVWYETLIAVLIGMGLRFRFDLRIGGFIGPVFILQFFSPVAIVTVWAAAIFTVLAIKSVSKKLPLTSRQNAYMGLILGGLVAWASLYWAAVLQWQPAIEANRYHVAPMLAVGLLAADMIRSNEKSARVLIGSAVTVGAIAIFTTIAIESSWLVSAVFLLLTAFVLLRKPIESLRADWKNAERVGLLTRS